MIRNRNGRNLRAIRVIRGSNLIILNLSLLLASAAAFAVEKPEALLPLDKFDKAALERVQQVVPGYTFHRKIHIPHKEIHARLDAFEYLVDHLDLCSIIGEKLNLLRFRSQRQPDGAYFADDRQGACGYLWPLYAAKGERVFFVQGSDHSDKPVEGRAVVLLRFREKSPNVIEYELDAFVKIESWIKKILAKIFLPLVTGLVDRRFGDVLIIPVQVSELANSDPGKLLSAIDSMTAEDAARMREFRALIAFSTSKR